MTRSPSPPQDLVSNPSLVDLVPPLGAHGATAVREPPKSAIGLPRMEAYDGEWTLLQPSIWGPDWRRMQGQADKRGQSTGGREGAY